MQPDYISASQPRLGFTNLAIQPQKTKIHSHVHRMNSLADATGARERRVIRA